MSIQPDHWIIKQCTDHYMINPFVRTQIKEDDNGNKIISYGVSSYGYDIRVANEFRYLNTAQYQEVPLNLIDPKKDSDDIFTPAFKLAVAHIPPNSCVLARSLERFKIPRDVLAVCLGKSTYARCGIVVNVTPLEPEWEGYLTIEISNTTPLPVKVYANEGIAQLLFYKSDSECKTSYKDKQGKYQNQVGVTGARL